MKKLHLIAIIFFMGISLQGFSQRYLTETFTDVTVTSDVVYGKNWSVIATTPLKFDNKCDVYEPTGDTASNRPLVIVLHTGSFLPAVNNGQATGSKKDSAVVEMCMRFAKKGYVAVAADYRLGWSSQSKDQDVRTGTLINAVYRAIQDAKNCVRFFKNDGANANTFKIDSTKIAVGGFGSGGYIAVGYANFDKVHELQVVKFADLNTKEPYVDQTVAGNFNGTNATAQNLPNYPYNSSAINMIFNIGGASGDSTWIEAGEPPVVGMHCYKDPFAPFKSGAIIVPNTGDFVVTGHGSHDIVRINNRLNNNAAINEGTYTDVYTTRASQVNDGLAGLFPFITPTPGADLSGGICGPQKEQASPWDWWDEAKLISDYNATGAPTPGIAVNCAQMSSNPDMSAAKARLYIDTIQGFITPRMACALGLPGTNCAGFTQGINENVATATANIFPNPASTVVNIVATSTIKTVELIDLTGRVVLQAAGLNTKAYTIQTEGVTAGLYIARITTTDGIVSKKIILE